MDKQSLCRICLVGDVRMHSIVNTNLQDLYEKLTAVPFQTKDSRPLQVCYLCYARLQNCYRLQATCLHSEKLFTQMLEDNEIKPTISQNINTLKIVDSIKPLNLIWEDPDDGDSNMDYVGMTDKVPVKEEIVEELDSTHQEMSTQYTGPEVIVKTEYIGIEDYQPYNYTNNTGEAEDNISSESELITIKDIKLEEGTVQTEESKGKLNAKKLEQADMKEIEIEAVVDNFIDEVDTDISDKKIVNKCHNLPTTVKSYRCDVCEKYFYRKSHLKSHSRTHTGEKPYKCDVCDRCFFQKSHLNIHRNAHFGVKPYKCDVCEKSFTQSSSLKEHHFKHIGVKPYKCDICKKCFTSNRSLKGHIRLHTGEKPYKCDICAKYFSVRGKLTNHVRMHTGDKPYKCDICDKRFSRKSNLNAHNQRHAGVKPYKCEICGKCFSEKRQLTLHYFIHSGEKPYKCDACSKGFNNRGNLVNHIRCIHTSEKPHKCDICEKRFKLKPNLKRHIRTSHE